MRNGTPIVLVVICCLGNVAAAAKDALRTVGLPHT